MSYYSSCQYNLHTIAGTHSLGIQYYVDGDYVEIKNIQLQESTYFSPALENVKRSFRSPSIKRIRDKRMNEIFDHVNSLV